jgi:hypothetical protein
LNQGKGGGGQPLNGGSFEETEQYFVQLDEDKEEIIRTIIEKRSAYPYYFERCGIRYKDEATGCPECKLI